MSPPSARSSSSRTPAPASFSKAAFALLLIALHLPLLHWPYFWDEIGQFVPAALDIYHSGELVPHSTIPNVHPPALMLWIAGVWRCFGLTIVTTRAAMLVFALFVGGNFLPYQIMMIPVRDLMVRIGLYDTTAALVIFHIAFQTGFATLFMRNFIAALPDELFQAARAEGATPFQTLVHVVVPLVRPALAALAILIFTFVWNDYFWAVVLTVSDTVKPVTAGLANLRGEWVSAWNLISAGTIVVAVPPVVMFFLMQRHFIAGLTMGAVKG